MYIYDEQIVAENLDDFIKRCNSLPVPSDERTSLINKITAYTAAHDNTDFTKEKLEEDERDERSAEQINNRAVDDNYY